MLVLTRKVGERIVIGDAVVIEVLGIDGNRVRLGVRAPGSVAVLRAELHALAAPPKRDGEEKAP